MNPRALFSKFIPFLFPLALLLTAFSSAVAPEVRPYLAQCAGALFALWLLVLLVPQLFNIQFRPGFLGTDPAGTKLDNVAQYGSQTVTISSKIYVFEKISIKRGTKRVVQNNEVGVPSGKVLTKDLETATATVQLPDAAATAFALFTEISLVPEGGGTAKVFHVEEVGPEFDQNGIRKFTCSLSEKLGS